MKAGYYWVLLFGRDSPEVAWRYSGKWLDFGDDPGAIPEEHVVVLRGPLRPPPVPERTHCPPN